MVDDTPTKLWEKQGVISGPPNYFLSKMNLFPIIIDGTTMVQIGQLLCLEFAYCSLGFIIAGK